MIPSAPPEPRYWFSHSVDSLAMSAFTRSREQIKNKIAKRKLSIMRAFPDALDLLIELAARVRTLSGGAAPLRVTGAVTDQPGIYNFTVQNIDGKNVNLSKYKGKVLLNKGLSGD